MVSGRLLRLFRTLFRGLIRRRFHFQFISVLPSISGHHRLGKLQCQTSAHFQLGEQTIALETPPKAVLLARHSFTHSLQTGNLFGPLAMDDAIVIPSLYRRHQEGIDLNKVKNPIPSTTISLGPFIDSGHLYDVFSIASSTKPLYSRTVAKVFCPKTCPASSSTGSALSEQEARHCIMNENIVFRKHLLPLQGKTVPLWMGLFGGLLRTQHGLFESEVEIWIAIMEHVGEAVRLADIDP